MEVINTDGKYFGHDTALITDRSGYSFTPQDFNSFEYGEVLGTIGAGFNYDTIALTYNDSFVELTGNTLKLKDTVYYDVNQQTFNLPDGSFSKLSDLSGVYVSATEDSFNIFTDTAVTFSDMISGGQVMPTPYWAGVPVGTRQEMPTEINVKALMFENSDDKVTHWVTDPSQDNSLLEMIL